MDLKHVIERIQSTSLQLEPFPHLQVQNILPEELYEQIVRQNKTLKHWNVYHKPSRKHGLPKRQEIHILSERGAPKRVRRDPFTKERVINSYDIDRLIPDHAIFDFKGIQRSVNQFRDDVRGTAWERFRSILTSQELAQAILDKFADELRKLNRYPSDASILDRNIQMNKDRGGFSMDPHTDTEFKLLFGLFYLADDDKHRDFSTILYRSKSVQRSWRTTPIDRKIPNTDFEPVKYLEYLPNTMAIMLKTDESWHGVRIPENDIERYTVYYSLCEDKKTEH